MSLLRRAAGAAAVVPLVLLGLALAAPAQAAGTTRYVATTGSDTDNDCTRSAHPCRTIQYAVDQAGAGDTVTVAGGTYHESVRIGISLTLDGAGSSGSGRTTVNGNGNENGPSIWVDGTDAESTPQVTIEHVDISGNAAAPGIVTDGASTTVRNAVVDRNGLAGLLVESGTATASGSTFSGNVPLTGDAGFGGFGVATFGGSAAVSTSTLSGNELTGVYNIGGAHVAIETSTLSANDYAGVANGPGGTITVHDSTLSGNHGAGVYAQASSTEVSHSTIAGTSKFPTTQGPPPVAGGGIVYLAATPEARTAGTRAALFAPRTLSVADRTYRVAPNVRALADAAGPGVTLLGTIVAQQSGVADCAGAVTDSGYNLDGDGTCQLSATGSVARGSAKLGALGSHGGPTQTQVPAKGSQAIDAIPSGSGGCTSGATDQRGVARPQGSKCDIGAVEVAQPPLVITPSTLPHGTAGTAYSARLTASGGLGAPYVFSLAAGSHLPPGLALSSTGVISGTPSEDGTYTFTVSVDDPVTKRYTLVIAPAHGANGGGTAPISNTGTPVGSMSAVGAGAVLAGLVLLYGAGVVGRRPGRHRG